MTDSPLFSASSPARSDSSRPNAPRLDLVKDSLDGHRLNSHALDGHDSEAQSAPQSTLTASRGELAPTITITIPAQAEYVLVVRLAVTGVASRMAFSFDQIEEIKLAVAEACNNAILHAAPNATETTALEVTVKLVPHPDRLEINVSDEGYVPPPGLPAPRRAASVAAASSSDGSSSEGSSLDLPEGGMGLLLMQTLMDEVTHQTGEADRTVVRMVKYLARR